MLLKNLLLSTLLSTLVIADDQTTTSQVTVTITETLLTPQQSAQHKAL